MRIGVGVVLVIADGPATAAQIASGALALGLTPSGHLLVGDSVNACIREVW